MKKFHLMSLGLIAMFVIFALIPDSLWNWLYDYLQFLPSWGILACVAVAVGCLFVPLSQSLAVRRFGAILFCLCLWAAFVIFRTHVHCFGGDGAVGLVPTDLSIRWRSFIPPLPGVGRLDTYGQGIITVLAAKAGILQRIPGMSVAVGCQFFCFFWGAVYILIAFAAFRRRLGLLLVVLTMPYVFNFFGNVDSYPLPLTFALVFLLAAIRVMPHEKPSLPMTLSFGLLWMFGGWVHPLTGMVGFLPAIMAARWLNGICKRRIVSDTLAVSLFGILFAIVIEIGYHKGIFSAPFMETPPVFSVATVIHALNTCILPVAPLAGGVLLSAAPRETKKLNLTIFGWQLVAFAFSHYTQGVNDQFPYMLSFAWMALPWLVTAACHPIKPIALRFVLAVNLLTLIPMVWVQSSDLTIRRAQVLYPIDDCKHNKEMSWQMHLGLILADCLEDRPAVKRAVLSTFDNGARRANPAAFRGGNLISSIAFHYHYGEFTQGRILLSNLLKQNPETVRYFLSPRPGFAYMNRERLYDDLYELFPIASQKPHLKQSIDGIRVKAASERYTFIQPSYAKCPY